MPGRSPGYAGARDDPGRARDGQRPPRRGRPLRPRRDQPSTCSGRTPIGCPAEASDDGSEVNDASIVLLGSFEGRRFLLMGDAEAEVEAELAARGLPTVDLLKTGHHGSRTSTTAALVAATRPRVAAISVGARNDYGHPSRDVLARLEGAGSAVLRTDEVGTIDMALGTAGVEVRTERPATGEDPEQSRRVGARTPAAEPGRPAGLPYDRRDARPVAHGRCRTPPLARSARVASPPCARRRRDRGLACGALRGQRNRRRSRPRGSGRAPPRRGQGHPRDGPGRRPPARRGLLRVARCAWNGRAGACGGGPPGHAAARALRRRLAGIGPDRRASRRLRGQARRPAARVDGCAVRRLATALPGRLVGGRRRAGTNPGAGTRSGRLCSRRA